MPLNITDKKERDKYNKEIYKPKNQKIFLKEEIKKTGYKHKHCCLEMTYHLATSSLIEDKNDADIIIEYHKPSSYGIPIHDGGSSMVSISFCPWCGEKL